MIACQSTVEETTLKHALPVEVLALFSSSLTTSLPKFFAKALSAFVKEDVPHGANTQEVHLFPFLLTAAITSIYHLWLLLESQLTGRVLCFIIIPPHLERSTKVLGTSLFVPTGKIKRIPGTYDSWITKRHNILLFLCST